MILLDTNVISEVMKPFPDQRVIAWFELQDTAVLATTVVTVAEILHGIAELESGRRREDLAQRFDTFLDRGFRWAIWAFEAPAAWQYGELVANRRRLGRPIGIADATIAAIARDHGASIATRNVGDFEACGVDLIDPWAAGKSKV